MCVTVQLMGVVRTVVVILTVHSSTNRNVPTHRDDRNLKIIIFKVGKIRNDIIFSSSSRAPGIFQSISIAF